MGQDSVGAASAFYLETQGDPTGGGSASVAAPFGDGAGLRRPLTGRAAGSCGNATGSSRTSPWSTDLRFSKQVLDSSFGRRLLRGRRQSTGAQGLLRGTQTFWSREQDELGAGAGSRSTQRAPEAQFAFRRLSFGCASRRPCVQPKGKGPTETLTRIAGFSPKCCHHTVETRPSRSPPAEPCGSQPRGPRTSLPPGALVTPARLLPRRACHYAALVTPPRAASSATPAGA